MYRRFINFLTSICKAFRRLALQFIENGLFFIVLAFVALAAGDQTNPFVSRICGFVDEFLRSWLKGKFSRS
jgi:hypothetical protein